MVILLFIRLVLIWQVVYCLTNTDICLEPKLKCDPINVNGKLNCHINRCIGQFKYRCDFETCAKDRSACDDFSRMKSKLRLQIMPFAHQATLYRFHLFIKSLGPCQKSIRKIISVF